MESSWGSTHTGALYPEVFFSKRSDEERVESLFTVRRKAGSRRVQFLHGGGWTFLGPWCGWSEYCCELQGLAKTVG